MFPLEKAPLRRKTGLVHLHCSRYKNPMRMLFLLLSIVSLIIGVVGHNNPLVTGFGKAMAGVFFIVFYIMHMFRNVKA